jgi:hypothetical protein
MRTEYEEKEGEEAEEKDNDVTRKEWRWGKTVELHAAQPFWTAARVFNW